MSKHGRRCQVSRSSRHIAIGTRYCKYVDYLLEGDNVLSRDSVSLVANTSLFHDDGFGLWTNMRSACQIISYHAFVMFEKAPNFVEDIREGFPKRTMSENHRPYSATTATST